MEISNFTFESRQVLPSFFETIIIAPNGIRFGCTYKSRTAAPNETIFSEFVKSKSNFFIDTQSEIIKDEPVTENKPIIEINS